MWLGFLHFRTKVDHSAYADEEWQQKEAENVYYHREWWRTSSGSKGRTYDLRGTRGAQHQLPAILLTSDLGESCTKTRQWLCSQDAATNFIERWIESKQKLEHPFGFPNLLEF